MRAVGLKFGRWVDVVTMQLSLGEGEKTLPADA
jgi:phosphinothricin acetyltransferase